ncbi:unnamed protein product [Blepharisma stoltei]|uniref:ADP-ribosylation factor n=1 Tax=Blepharisma stoltei TaxID=1481888 RepID=A0AAU9JQX8_9CILI|nr:unnamed protein product [Blepharisma stoltei]
MGNLNRRSTIPQILLVGLQGAGKSTLLYAEIADSLESTQGYNYEVRNFLEDGEGKDIGIWDVSGKEALLPLWSSFYKNILFSGVIFVIDSDSNEQKLEQALGKLHHLTNEEELRDAIFLVIFNTKSNKEKRKPGDLFKICSLEEIHRSIKIRCVELNLKGYSEEFRDSMKWFYQNLI